MQKTLPILGLFAVLIVGMTTPALAEYDKWDDRYKELEKEFDEKRQQIDRHFQEEFEELDRNYEELKTEIYDKMDSNPELSDTEIDAMFDELFLEFDEKRKSLESDMMRQFQELDESFEKELRLLDEKARQHYEEHEMKDREFHEDDPEWKSIEPLAKRIMEIIPMEKIQRLWESGEIEQLVELIVSETDLTYDQAKRVVAFFDRYDDRDHNRDNYPEPHPVPETDIDKVLRLEQRIAELEDENQMLRETIKELEEKVVQINAVLMEQVKFIYEWVRSQ